VEPKLGQFGSHSIGTGSLVCGDVKVNIVCSYACTPPWHGPCRQNFNGPACLKMLITILICVDRLAIYSACGGWRRQAHGTHFPYAWTERTLHHTFRCEVWSSQSHTAHLNPNAFKSFADWRTGYCFLYVADDEFGEKSVCVLLDGEESELTFVDHPSSEMSVSIVLQPTA
jgi:hypothetical protein